MIDEDAIRQRWEAVGSQLDERGRRLFAAGEVRTAGWGGLAVVSKITGLARSTINRGEDDIDAKPLPKGRVRCAGGGRRAVCENDPGLVPALERLVAPATLGDPMRPLIWVSKSMEKLAATLTEMGHPISADTVRKELVKLGFSRQSNRKADEGSKHPDRNAQFEHINAKVIAAQEVQLVNFSGSSASLTLRNSTTTAVSATGTGLTYLYLQGTGLASSFTGNDGRNDVSVYDASAWNPSIAINGGNSSDSLLLYPSNATLDLQPTTLTSVEGLYLYDSNLTALIDADTLTDVTVIGGSSGSKLVTAGSTLDLTGKFVSTVTVQSTNATGTTFTVDNSSTALQVFGGPGSDDTLQTSSFAFTAAQRDAVFNGSSIELIRDASGFYGDETANMITGTAAADSIQGGGGGDRLTGAGGADSLAGPDCANTA